MKTSIQNLFIALSVLALPALVQAQFTFTTNNGAITITGYNPAAGLNVVIPAMTNGYAVTSIGDVAFEGSGITNVTIPNSVTSIGQYAFDACYNLTRVTIPASVTSIGVGVFYGCHNLTNVTILNGVTTIGDYAFDSCSSLTSVTIPNSVTSIGVEAFADCSSLTSITVDASNPAYSSMNGVLFDKAQATLLHFPGALGGSYTIPNSVTSIGDGAFANCASLTSVTIPNSVASIGDSAFGSCTSLTSVTIPNSVTSIGNSAFGNCTSLMSVTIPASVTSIGDGAFEGSGITNVTIPNSITSIGQYAFFNCTSLTSVTIPNSVASIGANAFVFCFSLTTAYFQGNAPPDDGSVFARDPATVYYLAGTTGWGSMFGGVPTALWNPQVNMFSFTGGQFGFTVTGPTNAVIVVEACTNLSHPLWLPVSTNALSGLGTSAFSDPTGYPMRYYRFRSP